MKITSELLRRCSAGPLGQAKYLDLSGKRIGLIQGLDGCRRLQTLVLHSNNIDAITNIECCTELWNVDLTGNKVRTINGLAQFPFLGSLLLSSNALDWAELRKISHTHILSMTLGNNPKLIKDHHYRKHVVDLLPHLWMLDGQLITAGERRSVKEFFAASATTTKPVRHKNNSRLVFIPSSQKNLFVTGIFGKRTSTVMTRFSLQELHNIELDRRRLIYLAEMMEEDMRLESEYRERKGQRSFKVPPLKKLMEQRGRDTEQYNMLLLLLVAMLMFNLNQDLLISTLETAKLGSIGGVSCSELVDLPHCVILRVVSLLLSAATIDRESNKDGGLYLQLYQSLQFDVHTLHSKTHLINSAPLDAESSHGLTSTLSGISTATNETHSVTPTFPSSSSISSSPSHNKSHTPSSSQQLMEHMCLLASEVVHLLCLVPLFFDLLDTDPDVINMVAIATRNPLVSNVVSHTKWSILNNGGSVWDVYHQLATYLLQSTTANVFSKRNAKPFQPPSPSSSFEPIPHASSQILQTQPKRHSHLPPPRSQSAGAVASFRRRHSTPPQPDLGDLVLCAPERLARIVALPERNVAVLQLNSVIQGMSGPPDSYFYTDIGGLVWDRVQGYWTRDDLVSELSTGRLNPSPDSVRADYSQNLTFDSSTRPVSQLSYISEDLQTIPSVEELSLDEVESRDGREEEEPSLTVNISSKQSSTQRSNTPKEIGKEGHMTPPHTWETSLLSQLTEQLSLHPELEESTGVERYEVKEDERPLTYEEWVIDKQLSGRLATEMDLTNLIVSIPKLTHPEMWESDKSLPNTKYSSLSRKPHSCAQLAATPSPDHSSMSDVSRPLSPSVSLSPFHETLTSKPKLAQAWSTPRPGQPKQTVLSKTRAANREHKTLPSSPSVSSLSSSKESIIFYSHQSPSPSPSVPHNTPTHMAAYNAHSRLVGSKYQFQPVKKRRSKSHLNK